MFRVLPPFGQDPRGVAEVVNGIMNGKTNNTGTITLATGNATTTTLNDERISPDTKIILIPFSDAAEDDAAPYAQFVCTAGQTAASANTAYALGFNTVTFQNGLSLVDTTKITTSSYGIYDFIFNFQLENQDNAQHEISIWTRKNNSNVAYSNRIITVPARKSAGIYGYVTGSVNIYQEMEPEDYIEIMWSTSSTQVSFNSTGVQTTPTRPETPCKIVTANYIAPKAYSNVYVSAQTNGSATISHFANDTANKTYAYVLVG